MKTSHQNKLFEMIQHSQLPIQQFKRLAGMGTDGKPYVSIHWLPRDYSFHISEVPSPAFEVFSVLWTTPASGGHAVQPSHKGIYPHSAPFNHVEVLFTDWLYHIKKAAEDISTVDLWSFNHSALEKADFDNTASSQPFSAQEKVDLRQALVRFEEKLAEVAVLSDTQMEAVHHKLDYLSERLDKHSRFDWAAMARDILMGILINSFVDRDTAAQVLNYCGAFLADSSKKFLKWFDTGS